MTSYTIACLPGDGVGPEVLEAARRVLSIAADRRGISLDFAQHDFGGIAIDNHGDPYPAPTRQACATADAIMLGAVGGPRWDGGAVRPEQGLLALRQDRGLFANLRPVTVIPGLESLSPLRPERATGVDLLIVRELTGGLYFGEREEGDDMASDLCRYSREEVERVAHVAFRAARGRGGRVTSVDKANVLATSRLWRRTVEDVQARDYPDIALDHMLVDAMAMKLVQSPGDFDVLLTENLFGDILSDEASVIAGSIGLAPSASLGLGTQGLYEPIHGSAPDIAGRDIANPVGAVLSAAMLLRHSLGHDTAAHAIECAVADALAAGRGTTDIGRGDGCRAFTDTLCERIA